MTFVAWLRRPAAGSIALAALLASAAGAQAAVAITDAKIEGGKLVVSGTGSSGAQLRLDGQEGAAFNVRSGADGTFGFSLVYHPGDCVVTVEVLVPPYLTVGESAEGLVANCGRDGVTARGAWVQSAGYVVNDLVTHDGSTWRARRNNAGRIPAAGADWEIFAAAGETAGAAGGDETELGARRTAPTGPAGGDLSGTYPNPQIADDAVGTNQIAEGAVKSIDILNNSIGSQDIAHDSITGADIATDGITSSEILNGTVSAADIGAGAVTGTAVFDNSLSSDDLGNSSVNSSEIASNAVGPTEIADNSIDSGEIVDGTLSASDLATDSVDSSEIAAGAVGSSEIASGAVTNSELAANSVDGSKVASNSLTTADIAGTAINGIISVGAGEVANGRCEDFSMGVGGAQTGEAVIMSLQAAVQQGVLLYATRVPSDGTVTLKICNLSGGAMAAITSLPIRVITFD